MQADILITAPMPPFLYEPLKAGYRCHDYTRRGQAALLAPKVAPSAASCRAVVR